MPPKQFQTKVQSSVHDCCEIVNEILEKSNVWKHYKCLLHSLVENGVPASLANDQVSPLNDHYGNKESSMASVLYVFARFISLAKK